MVQTAKNKTECQIELFEDALGSGVHGYGFLILTAQSSLTRRCKFGDLMENGLYRHRQFPGKRVIRKFR